MLFADADADYFSLARLLRYDIARYQMMMLPPLLRRHADAAFAAADAAFVDMPYAMPCHITIDAIVIYAMRYARPPPLDTHFRAMPTIRDAIRCRHYDTMMMLLPRRCYGASAPRRRYAPDA